MIIKMESINQQPIESINQQPIESINQQPTEFGSDRVRDYNNLIALRSNFLQGIEIINQMVAPLQPAPVGTKIKQSVVNLKSITNEDINMFIRENCILDEKMCTKMSELRDAFNLFFNKDISLIAFSKKFNEVSIIYPVERSNMRINSQGGLWIKGIGIKTKD